MDSDIYRVMLDQLYDGVYMVDCTGTIVYWNRAAEQITGYSAEEALGRRCSDNLLRHLDGAGQILCETGCPLKAALQDGQQREAAVYLHHKDGHRLPVLARASALKDKNGEIEGAVEIFTDNSRRFSPEHELERLRHLAMVDELTGLGNRRAADEALLEAHRQFHKDGNPYGVLFVDIDHFKSVNDRYGHDYGDKVLCMVANTLKEGLRQDDVVYRWGGEEFVLVLRESQCQAMEAIGERLRMLVENSWLSRGDERLGVTVSLGGCMARMQMSIEDVLKKADAALYCCKNRGRNQVRCNE